MKIRYEKECIQLGKLANVALNMPKNVIKPLFEDSYITVNIMKLDEEVKELKDELLTFNPNETFSLYVQKERIDFDRAILELSDCAACLAGLIAWIHKQKELQQNNEA